MRFCSVSPTTYDRITRDLQSRFIRLLKIYIVAGKIVRSAHSLQLHREIDETVTETQAPSVIHDLDAMLDEWVESLPRNVKYAANNADNPKMLTLCLIAFFVYYSATINLRMSSISFFVVLPFKL